MKSMFERLPRKYFCFQSTSGSEMKKNDSTIVQMHEKDYFTTFFRLHLYVSIGFLWFARIFIYQQEAHRKRSDEDQRKRKRTPTNSINSKCASLVCREAPNRCSWQRCSRLPNGNAMHRSRIATAAFNNAQQNKHKHTHIQYQSNKLHQLLLTLIEIQLNCLRGFVVVVWHAPHR